MSCAGRPATGTWGPWNTRWAMKGRLDNADDVEWLLAWLNSSCGDRVDFVLDETLRDQEFVTGPNEIRLASYAYQVLHGDACRRRSAVAIDGWWVGLN